MALTIARAHERAPIDRACLGEARGTGARLARFCHSPWWSESARRRMCRPSSCMRRGTQEQSSHREWPGSRLRSVTVATVGDEVAGTVSPGSGTVRSRVPHRGVGHLASDRDTTRHTTAGRPIAPLEPNALTDPAAAGPVRARMVRVWTGCGCSARLVPPQIRRGPEEGGLQALDPAIDRRRGRGQPVVAG